MGGTNEKLYLVPNKNSEPARTVTLATRLRDADDAVQDLDGKDLQGGRVRVELARPPGRDRDRDRRRSRSRSKSRDRSRSKSRDRSRSRTPEKSNGRRHSRSNSKSR